MGFTVDPVKITDLILQRRSSSRRAVADYLSRVAEEATELAEIWEGIAKELPLQPVNLREGPVGTRINRRITPNGKSFWMLSSFYRSLTSAIGGKVDHEFQESFISGLGRLLRSRELTLRAYQDFMQSEHFSSTFMDNTIMPDDFLQIDSLVEALHREAAALHALAATYRVNNA